MLKRRFMICHVFKCFYITQCSDRNLQGNKVLILNIFSVENYRDKPGRSSEETLEWSYENR